MNDQCVPKVSFMARWKHAIVYYKAFANKNKRCCYNWADGKVQIPRTFLEVVWQYMKSVLYQLFVLFVLKSHKYMNRIMKHMMAPTLSWRCHWPPPEPATGPLSPFSSRLSQRWYIKLVIIVNVINYCFKYVLLCSSNKPQVYLSRLSRRIPWSI